MRLLCLDLSSSVGWARWVEGYERPAFGTQAINGENIDEKGVKFCEWLVSKLIADGITHLAVEKPFINMAHSSEVVVEQSYVLPALAGLEARRRGIRFKRIPIGEWRQKVLGVTMAPKHLSKNDRRTWLKQKAIDYCLAAGWPIDREPAATRSDAADALCICEYQRFLWDPAYAASRTPLFAGSAA